MVAGRDGAVTAATVDDARAERLGGLARDLVAGADSVRGDLGRDALAQLQAATPDGSVFVVLDGDRIAVATTGAEPTVGLVFYDLKTLLRQLAAADADDGETTRPRPRPPRSLRLPRSRQRTAAMPKRRLLVGALLGAGSFVGTILYRRRRRAAARASICTSTTARCCRSQRDRPTPTGCSRSPATCWRRPGSSDRRLCCNCGWFAGRREGSNDAPLGTSRTPRISPSRRRACGPPRKRPESGSGRAIVAVRP